MWSAIGWYAGWFFLLNQYRTRTRPLSPASAWAFQRTRLCQRSGPDRRRSATHTAAEEAVGEGGPDHSDHSERDRGYDMERKIPIQSEDKDPPEPAAEAIPGKQAAPAPRGHGMRPAEPGAWSDIMNTHDGRGGGGCETAGEKGGQIMEEMLGVFGGMPRPAGAS